MNSYNGFSPQQRQDAFNWLKTQKRPEPTTCHACSQTEGPIMFHSEDYSAPYGDHIGQYHLCYICHMMVHCRFRAPERWLEYKRAVAQGFRYEPIGKNWPLFTARFLRGNAISQPAVQGDIPMLLVLEVMEQHGRNVAVKGMF
jgi:hypothetical protein